LSPHGQKWRGRRSNMGVRCHKSDDLGGGSLAEPQKTA
jgi:hypothetical protein